MNKLLAVIALLILSLYGYSFVSSQDHKTKEIQCQEILSQFNQSILEKQNISELHTTVISVGDLPISPTPTPVAYEKIEQRPEEQKKIPQYEAIGRIKIEKINIDYPILATTTKETLEVSITLLYGKALNIPGNTILAGHNMRNGSLFGRLKELCIGDLISLQDDSGCIEQYEVFDIYIVDPSNLDPLDQDTNGKKVLTLITCTNRGTQRLIIKACSIN